MSVIIGTKVKPPKGDFGGERYAVRLHDDKDGNPSKLKLNSNTMNAIVKNPNGEHMFVPIFLTKGDTHRIEHFVGFEYVSNDKSKKLPAGKISKNGLVNNKEAVEVLTEKVNDRGMLFLDILEEEDRFGIHVAGGDTGIRDFKPNEFADVIANQYDIEIVTLVVFAVSEDTTEDVDQEDEEPVTNAAEATAEAVN